MGKNKGLLISLLVVGAVIVALLAVILSKGGIFIIEGLNGKDGKDGLDGTDGMNGVNGADGVDGTNGKSAYELAVENGFEGSLNEWLLSLVVQGSNGKDGAGVRDVRIDENGHLVITLTDGRVLDAGYVGAGSEVAPPDLEPDEDGFYEVYETVVMNELVTGLKLRSIPKVPVDDDDSTVLFWITPGTELLRVGDQQINEGFSRLIYNGQVCYARSKYFDLKYVYEGEIPEIHLPAHIVLTEGAEAWFYTDQILPDRTDDLRVTYSYSGSGTRVFEGSDAFAVTPMWTSNASVTPHAPESASLVFRVEKRVDGEMRTLVEKTVKVTVVEEQRALTLSGLFIGDSRISDGTVVNSMNAKMENLTLLGTRQTMNSGNYHEGRSSWSVADFWGKAEKDVVGTTVTNAFYNPAVEHFDFAYYMEKHQAGQPLDFVVINLGANDNFSRASVETLDKMVESIQSYCESIGKTIPILILTEYLSPADGYHLSQGYNVNVEAKREKQFAYFTYLSDTFEGREDEGIYLLPNYLCINDWSDWTRQTVTTERGEEEKITDVVHLGTKGYQKEAAMIRSYLYWLFGT